MTYSRSVPYISQDTGIFVGLCDVPDSYRPTHWVVWLVGALNVVGGPRRQRPALICFSSQHAGRADELIKRRLNDLDR